MRTVVALPEAWDVPRLPFAGLEHSRLYLCLSFDFCTLNNPGTRLSGT